MANLLKQKNSDPVRFAKEFIGKFGRRLLGCGMPAESDILQYENASIAKRNLPGLACRTLIEPI